MTEVVEHTLQDWDGDFRAVVLGGTEQPNPACAAVFGEPRDGCLVRIQSRCLYGEIFGSTNCDCLFQLRKSLEEIKQHSGVLIYLDQEGRGAGLLTKARGYRLCQDTGMHTFDAYAEMNCKADTRSYEDAAALLKQLGLKEVTLLTNNPEKLAGLELGGIKVRLRSLVIPEPGEHTRAYLVAKRDNQEHMLSIAARLRWRVIRLGGAGWLSRHRAALRKRSAGRLRPVKAVGDVAVVSVEQVAAQPAPRAAGQDAA